MPTTPYVKVLVSVNSGATQSGGLTIVDGDTADLSLEDADGITSCLWEIYDYPTGMSTPSGWTADATAERFYVTTSTPHTPPQLDFTGVPWGKFMLRATGNNGMKGGSSLVFPADGTTMRDESTALQILSPIGLEDIAALETTQFYSVDAWIGSYKANLRTWSGAMLPSGSVTGQLTYYDVSAGAWQVLSNVLAGSGYISLGADPAQTGALRLSTNTGLYWRYSGADLALVHLGATGWATLGSSSAVGVYLRSAGYVKLTSGGNEVLSVHSASGVGCGGYPLHSFHDAISPTTAQKVSGSGTPSYVALQFDGSATTKLLSELGFVAAVSGGTEPSREIGFRVKWRNDTLGATRYVDDIALSVDVRRDGSGNYYVQCGLVGTTTVTGEGAANSAVTLDFTGGTGAEYRVTVTADSGGAHTIAIAMMQDTVNDRNVMVECWKGASQRNFV